MQNIVPHSIRNQAIMLAALVSLAEWAPGAAAEHAMIGKPISGRTLGRGAHVTCWLQGG
jgi:hypothetical protein